MRAARSDLGVSHPGLVVAIAIFLSLPMAPGVIDGGIPVVDALLRFLGALLLSWAAVAVFEWIGRVYGRRRLDTVHPLPTVTEEPAPTMVNPVVPTAQRPVAANQAPAPPSPGAPGVVSTPPRPGPMEPSEPNAAS